jgi:uncharacterized protein YjbI with pentapeptide repeats
VAKEAHLKILEQGVKTWNEWRAMHDTVYPDLRGADFTEKNLNGVNFIGGFLSEAQFSGAYLVGTNFSGAFLDRAQFDGALILGSNFGSSTIAHISNQKLNILDIASAVTDGARLEEANFCGSYLGDSSFSSAYLVGTNFSDCMMKNNQFVNVDLSQCKGLETISHDGPSNIDIDTLYHSGGNIPESFLRGAGVPEPFIVQMKSLVAAMSPIEFYSCFISHSSKDKEFAERLLADLRGKNVRCWFAPEDLKIGDRLRPAFDEAIRVHDKLMVLLSENSVSSPWVEKEVETAFEKERREKRTVLFPIRLDDAVMETNEAWAADIRRTRHIGDFRDWKNHDSYKKAFERLLRDLKAEV